MNGVTATRAMPAGTSNQMRRTRVGRRISEATSFGQPVVAYDPTSKGAESYKLFAREFLKRANARRAAEKAAANLAAAAVAPVPAPVAPAPVQAQ